MIPGDGAVGCKAARESKNGSRLTLIFSKRSSNITGQPMSSPEATLSL